jgi:hypothetical protein
MFTDNGTPDATRESVAKPDPSKPVRPRKSFIKRASVMVHAAFLLGCDHEDVNARLVTCTR